METDQDKPESKIERPDFKDPKKFEDWINQYVTRPSKSLREPQYSPEEQLEKTKEQFRLTARDLFKLGIQDSTIEEILINAASDIQED